MIFLKRIGIVFIGLVLAVLAFTQGTQGEEMSFKSSTTGVTEVPAAPENGGPRNWEVIGVSRTLNLREQPSTKARIIASYAPGTILDNLGCQHDLVRCPAVGRRSARLCDRRVSEACGIARRECRNRPRRFGAACRPGQIRCNREYPLCAVHRPTDDAMRIRSCPCRRWLCHGRDQEARWSQPRDLLPHG